MVTTRISLCDSTTTVPTYSGLSPSSKNQKPHLEMARFITVAAFLLVAVAAASAQDFFGGNQFSSGPRDARQNRGPVTFPVTSPGSETSGVRVGASGYGFVPPGSRGGIGPHGAAGPNPGFGFYPGFNSFYW